MTFGDRFRMVVGEHPFAWAYARHFPKATIQSFLACKIRPHKANLDKLVRLTGIPESWWLSGEGAPPTLPAGWQPPTGAPRAEYLAGGRLAKAPDSILSDELVSSVSLATRVLLVAQAAPWFPKDFEQARVAALVSRALALLACDAGGDRRQFERMVEHDSVLEAALRLALETERAAPL